MQFDWELIARQLTIDQNASEVSIEGIEGHSTVNAFSARDPFKL